MRLYHVQDAEKEEDVRNSISKVRLYLSEVTKTQELLDTEIEEAVK